MQNKLLCIANVLSGYYSQPPEVSILEHYEVDKYELSYYLLSFTLGGKLRYLALLEGGLVRSISDKDSVLETIERLKEQAGITVLGWHVINSAKASLGKEVISSDEAIMNIDNILFNLNPTDNQTPLYTLLEISLDFKTNIYKSN